MTITMQAPISGGIYARNILNEQTGFIFSNNQVTVPSTNTNLVVSGMHKYEFEWTKGSFKFGIDGQIVAEISDNLFSERYYPVIILEPIQGSAQVIQFKLGCNSESLRGLTTSTASRFIPSCGLLVWILVIVILV